MIFEPSSSPFGGSEDHAEAETDKVVRQLLVFDFGGATFGVDAMRVDGVIPWREPVPLPRSDRRVRGVVQDRGRIVVVLATPTGAIDAAKRENGSRIVVCSTRQGCIGLPATATRTVGPVELTEIPTSGAIVDSSAGVLTYLDPEKFVDGELGRDATRKNAVG